MQNPFNISFGIEPLQYINRNSQSNEIITNFKYDNPSSQVYLITGVRGSGKTVLLSTICDHFKEETDWIVVELNPERNLLESLAAKIYEKSKAKFKFHIKEFSFSFHGLSISLTGENQIYDVESLLESMLKYLKEKNKKVLVAIDEVTASKEIKTFAHSFQILLRQKLPIFCIMTGLFENVRSLEDEKTLTFLYRAPKIELGPLNLAEIAKSFKETLNISEELSIALAKETKGYAFAYQTLGYLLYNKESKQLDKDLYFEYDSYLKEHAYDKIWSTCSPKEKEVLKLLTETNESAEILNKLNVTKGAYSSFRDRLIKKGLIYSKEWGKIDFTLPRFKEFILTEELYSF